MIAVDDIQLSRATLIITPGVERAEAHRDKLHQATILGYDEVLGPTGDFAPLDEALQGYPFQVLILVNRPPLDVTRVVQFLRRSRTHQRLYIIVLTPPDVEPILSRDLDVDDEVKLEGEANLLTVMATARLRYLRHQELRQQFLQATRTAQSAIESMSDYGSLLRFLDLTDRCQSIRALANTLYDFLQSREMNVLFCLDIEGEKTLRPQGPLPRGTSQLLQQLKDSRKRIVAVDRFMGFRFEYITLLVTNGPSDNIERYGQLKDSLAHLCTIIDSRARSILIKERITEQHGKVLQIMNDVHQSSEDALAQVKTVMQDLVQNIEMAATTFNMTSFEEQKLLAIAHQAADNLQDLYDNNERLEAQFLNLINTMSEVRGLVSPQYPNESEDDASDEVELF